MCYYQVSLRFGFRNYKAQLLSVSLNTSAVYVPYHPGYVEYVLNQEHYFRTLAQAQDFINYIFSRYPNTAAARPVLDAQQLLLF